MESLGLGNTRLMRKICYTVFCSSAEAQMSHARIRVAASAHRLFKLWQDQNRLHRRVRRPQSQVAGKGSACEVD